MTTPQSIDSYVLCIDNGGYPESLEVRKIYAVLLDKVAESRQYIRVIDETGEDYLYPSKCFVPIEVPPKAAKVLPTGNVLRNGRRGQNSRTPEEVEAESNMGQAGAAADVVTLAHLNSLLEVFGQRDPIFLFKEEWFFQQRAADLGVFIGSDGPVTALGNHLAQLIQGSSAVGFAKGFPGEAQRELQKLREEAAAANDSAAFQFEEKWLAPLGFAAKSLTQRLRRVAS